MSQLAGGRGAYVPLQLARPVAAPPPALAESLDFRLLGGRRRRRRLHRAAPPAAAGRWSRRRAAGPGRGDRPATPTISPIRRS